MAVSNKRLLSTRCFYSWTAQSQGAMMGTIQIILASFQGLQRNMHTTSEQPKD